MNVPLVEWLDEIDSTNAELLRRQATLPARHALAARSQRTGRGRQGREWLSPPGNLYLSLFARLNTPVSLLDGLSLAAGIAVCRALHESGVCGAQIKWPNDIQIDGNKLGGLLIEIAAAQGEGCAVVIGLGLNIAMPPDHQPDQAWTDLATVGVGGSLKDWATRMTTAIATSVERFDIEGFAPFRAEWDALDALAGRSVEVSGSQVYSGKADGIDARGALRVIHAGGVLQCRSGEVRVRPA